MSRYEVVLRYDVDGHEYVFENNIRRFAGAEHARDHMVAETYDNLSGHAHEGDRVVSGPNGIDPDSMTVVCFGPTKEISKTILIRPKVAI